MSIYDYDDYKSYLKDALLQRKRSVSKRFTYERLAKACGVQKTYLSRALNGDGTHLSEDQLYGACEFLGLGRDERYYAQLLRGAAKTQLASRRAEMQQEICDVRARFRKSESHLQAEPIPLGTAELAAYHLDPHVMLVHIFLAVDRFAEDPRRIAGILGLSEETLTGILSQLQRTGFLVLDEGRYRLTRQNTHLSVDSPLYNPYRFMQRFKALERMQKLPPERSYNFSVVFSATEAVRAKIHARFLELLQSVEKDVGASADEEVYQMTFDLLDWSR